MLGWSVASLDDVHQPQAARIVGDRRKTHCVAWRFARKPVAQPARVAAVAQVAFGLEPLAWTRLAPAAVPVAQWEPGSVNPADLVGSLDGHEKRTRHSGILTELDSSRIEVLQQLLAQNPANTFVRYGLAMEFVNTGELDRAVGEFETLLAADPSYSAAYFHGGQTLEKLGRLDQARDFYRRGIAASRDPHAVSEMQAALDILGE